MYLPIHLDVLFRKKHLVSNDKFTELKENLNRKVSDEDYITSILQIDTYLQNRAFKSLTKYLIQDILKLLYYGLMQTIQVNIIVYVFHVNGTDGEKDIKSPGHHFLFNEMLQTK